MVIIVLIINILMITIMFMSRTHLDPQPTAPHPCQRVARSPSPRRRRGSTRSSRPP